jgi:hypothetical protein
MRITLHALRRHSCWLLLGGLVLAACTEGRDETRGHPPSGGGTSGAAGATGGGEAGNGGSGDGGTGSELRDAGVDAAPDAVAPGRTCPSLATYCTSAQRCPDLSTVRQVLRQAGSTLIVQRPCRANDGSPRVSVGATSGGLFASQRLYDPATGALVGAEFVDDVNFSCYGDIPRDCEITWPDDSFYAGCDALDAGAPATLGDAAPFACERVDAGL